MNCVRFHASSQVQILERDCARHPVYTRKTATEGASHSLPDSRILCMGYFYELYDLQIFRRFCRPSRFQEVPIEEPTGNDDVKQQISQNRSRTSSGTSEKRVVRNDRRVCRRTNVREFPPRIPCPTQQIQALPEIAASGIALCHRPIIVASAESEGASI